MTDFSIILPKFVVKWIPKNVQYSLALFLIIKMNICGRPIDICLNLQVLFPAIAGIRFSKYLVLARHEEPVIKFQLCASVSSVVAAPFILPNKAQRKMEQRKGTNVSGGENGTGNG